MTNKQPKTVNELYQSEELAHDFYMSLHFIEMVLEDNVYLPSKLDLTTLIAITETVKHRQDLSLDEISQILAFAHFTYNLSEEFQTQMMGLALKKCVIDVCANILDKQTEGDKR
jgi:hypothetical protein